MGVDLADISGLLQWIIFLQIWFGLAFGVVLLARHRSVNATIPFFVSLILSPVVGLIVAGTMNSVLRSCPFCCGLVRQGGSICSHCGGTFPAAAPAST